MFKRVGRSFTEVQTVRGASAEQQQKGRYVAAVAGGEDEEQHDRGTSLEVVAAARVPERLDTLDGLAAGWLLRFGPNTRDAYGRDLRSWLAWCEALGVDALRAGLHHADAYSRWLTEIATTRSGVRLAPSSVNRRMSALASFYGFGMALRRLSKSQ